MFIHILTGLIEFARFYTEFFLCIFFQVDESSGDASIDSAGGIASFHRNSGGLVFFSV